MQYIPYDKELDPSWLAGNMLGNGLGMLAQNWINRGEAKNMDNEAAQNKANQNRQFASAARALQHSTNDPMAFNTGLMHLASLGAPIAGITRDNIGSFAQGFDSRANHFDNFQTINQGKRLHGDGYTTLNQYEQEQPDLLSFLNPK